jgi:ABC-type phosphate transport system auxiliary subunit
MKVIEAIAFAAGAGFALVVVATVVVVIVVRTEERYLPARARHAHNVTARLARLIVGRHVRQDFVSRAQSREAEVRLASKAGSRGR